MNRVSEAKRSAFKSILAFMRRSKVNQFLVGYGAFFGLAMIIYISIVSLIVPTYYALAPARSFVDYYYARVADSPVGTEPQLTLCRKINYDNVKISGVRTFIYHTDDKNQESVAEYSFDANVSKDESTGNCVTVRLKGQPMVAGTYSTSTSVEFFVGGHRKTYSYQSNQYKMTPIEQSAEERIKDLQRQIDDINKTAPAGSSQSTNRAPAAAVPQQQTTQVPSQSQGKPQNTPKPADPAETPPQAERPTILGRVNQLLRGLGL